MSTEQSDGISHPVPLKTLSAVLCQSLALVRMVAKSLDVKVVDEHVKLPDALTLMRYCAARKREQDVLWDEQISKLQAANAREFELAMALDIVKRERSTLENQVEFLTAQLARSHERSDRVEAKLHELTESFVHLISQRDRLVAQTKMKSKASLKYHQGREVLYLEQPVNLHLLGQDDH
jgi:hypothetical protein